MSDAEKSSKSPAIASVIHEGLPTQLPDIDPDETQEWIASFDAMLDEPDQGATSVRRFLERMKAPGRAFIKAAGDPDAFIESVDPAWSGALPATFIHAPDGHRAHSIHGPISYARLRELADPTLPRK